MTCQARTEQAVTSVPLPLLPPAPLCRRYSTLATRKPLTFLQFPRFVLLENIWFAVVVVVEGEGGCQ